MIPKPSQHDPEIIPKRSQSDPKLTQQNCFSNIYICGKTTIRAWGESNRVPPGSDFPPSRGPNRWANPALESRLPSDFPSTKMQALGQPRASNYHLLSKTLLFELLSDFPCTELQALGQPRASNYHPSTKT